MMRRRDFITLLGGAAAAWPLAARGQQPAMPVIGFLHGASAQGFAAQLAGLRYGLGEIGYAEGRNVSIEQRWAEGHYDRLPALAADLVDRSVDVIAANLPGALAAKAATQTIPIVFTTGADPVAAGLVASLSRPGANLRGVSGLYVEVVPKRLELLHELVPTSNIIGLLVNPANPGTETLSRDLQAAARSLGLGLRVQNASTELDLDTAFASLVGQGVRALVIGNDGFFNSRAEQLVALASRFVLPTTYPNGAFVRAGGLMSYGGNFTDQFRLAGIYVGRILKGEKPANLPVRQATKLEFLINLKSAKALGLTIPPSLLVTADEVIE